MARLTRAEMAQGIMDLMAGQESEPSFYAQADALATGIGGTAALSGHDLDHALEYLDAICEGMREHVRAHWGQIENATKH